MPKKTRKQKLRADHRHLGFTPPVADQKPSPNASGPVTFQFQPATQHNPAGASMDTDELTAIRIDLSRTIILAIIAVGAELTIYWRYFR